ncbi:hypothetical protein AB5N19_04883 [Seiridium cardinale]
MASALVQHSALVSRRDRMFWSAESDCYLLAWLNLCVKKHKTHAFAETVINLLKEKFDMTVKKVQVRNKLIQKVRKNRNGTKFLQDIMTKGTKCLSTLPKGYPERIAEIETLFEPNFSEHLGRLSDPKSSGLGAISSLLASTSPGTTRNGPNPSENLQLQQPYDRRKRSKTVDPSNSSEPEIGSSHGLDGNRTQDIFESEVGSDGEINPTLQSSRKHQLRTRPKIVPKSSMDTRAISIASSNSDGNYREGPNKSPEPVILARPLTIPNESEQTQILATVKWYQDKIVAMDKKIEKMKHALTAPAGWTDISRLHYENTLMFEQMAVIQSHREKVGKYKDDAFGPGDVEIKTRIKEICEETSQACLQMFSTADLAERPFRVRNEQFRDVFAPALDPYTWGLLPVLSSSSPSMLNISCLLGAIEVCVKVFEVSVFDSLAMVEPLLTGWRLQTLCEGGPDALRRFDLIGINHHIHSEEFASKVKTTARLLSHGMATTLSSVNSERHDYQRGFPGAVSSISSLNTFEIMFEKALRLKADLLLLDKEYAAVFVQPGYPFDAATMEVLGHTPDGIPHNSQSDNVPNPSDAHVAPAQEMVYLCVFPAVYSSPSRGRGEISDWGTTGSLERCWRRFSGNGEFNRTDAKLVSRAIVIVCRVAGGDV